MLYQLSYASPRGMERETGIEPATNSLEGCDSTTELLPPAHLSFYQPPGPPARTAMLRSNRMLFESDKVMFEIYRETEYTGKYRVVYFTELQDHNKETEINHAMAGEHFYDGFIKNFRKDEAKEIINSLLGRLNNGERIDPQEVERALAEHMA